MKTIFKLFLFLSAIIVGVIAIIKFVQGCSWKDAVGIAEQLWKELSDACGLSNRCCEENTEDA